MKHLCLFSGIGGFSHGFAPLNIETVAFCEIAPFCQNILKKHWPGVPIFSDVNELNHEALQTAGVPPIDLVTAGFPCQPFSTLGKRAGADDPRHLWPQIVRLLCEIKPRFFLGENVRSLLSIDHGRVFGGILSDLSRIGYDAEWQTIPANALGAPHLRKRVWIVAYPCRHRCPAQSDQLGQVPGASPT